MGQYTEYQVNWLHYSDQTHRILPSVAGLLVAPARLQIGAYSFAGSVAELRELSGARVDDGLDLLLGLLRDGYDAIEILIDEQSHEHLKEAEGKL